MAVRRPRHHVIIGASAGGLAALEAIRSVDLHSTVSLVSKERAPLYSRVGLTHFLDGTVTVSEMNTQGPSYFDRLRATLLSGVSAVHVDPKRRTVALSKRTTLVYDTLLVASGSRSPHIQGLIQMMHLLGSNPSTTVLILGETGTGKELIARNIHALSSRAGKPFVDINCAAIPEHILESELFGYEAGAFTDAKKTKKGLFELAEGGTLFVDEIGDMPPAAQAKILRVIATKTLKRLGGTRDIAVDVRIVAATNKDLPERVKSGSFREDLYYRLNVMPLQLLPLSKRTEDIPLIAESLLEDDDVDAIAALCIPIATTVVRPSG